MARAAGIYEHLWRPHEMGIETAGQLIEPLERGISLMKQDPQRFRALDSPNGWGTYRDFLPWLETLLQACRDYADAKVDVSV